MGLGAIPRAFFTKASNDIDQILNSHHLYNLLRLT
jgi:hypothetical protein